MVRLSLCAVAAICLAGRTTLAQAVPLADSSADLAGESSSEVWIGYSPGSTSAGVLGRHTGITLGLVGVRWNGRISKSGSRSIFYSADLIPVARVTPIIEYHTGVVECPPPSFDCSRSSEIARGVGFNPFGFTAVYRGDRRVQWRIGAAAGFLMFDRRAPSDLATNFNFTAAIETGVQWVNRHGNGATLVYRLHHLSNAGTGNDNLAMLSHVISLGARWRLEK